MKGRQITFSEGDLQGMAAAFDPQRQPAPLVLGHPENDQPELGQAQKLLVKGSKLYALALVGTALEALVKARCYAKVSATFIPPFADSNPTPGAYYLKHIGFLGATPPAVKGMEDPSFTDRGDGVSFGETEAIIMPTGSFVFSRPGLTCDPERLALHRLATEYRETCPALSYAEAITLANGALTF
ncbi:MAG: hypothetical protein CGU28_12105 [Candidatus Dactylopiibacterium carminicum]|uniref:Uncharacterized protein n=2 Tax=Candidatus Dactylopiibacterium carminicum TaxID=857335 RepID=A0A272EPT9_9RHOO|nr:hypothetical protein BGI27_13405 [Candidatus Dactylopiibacterium carminicum]PAS92134.1 MAG: hypothetical protein CGU29_12775 [Candidatus Dactylopiibacterium carminicum]PAS95561.1 MAG: hypothetical protein CGU28_12105 [Candidatus Dactylopiibacterium carminicum]